MPEEPLDTDLERERIAIDRERLELEKKRLAIENRFFNKNMGVLITAAVSFAALVLSDAQLQLTREQHAADQVQHRLDLAQAQVNKDRDVAVAVSDQERRWNLELLTLTLTHRKELLSPGSPAEAAFISEMIKLAPPTVSKPILQHLQASAIGPQRTVLARAVEDVKRGPLDQLVGALWQGKFIYLSNGVTYGMDLQFVSRPERTVLVRMYNHGSNTWTNYVPVTYQDGTVVFSLPTDQPPIINKFVLTLVNGTLQGEVDQGSRRIASIGFQR